MLSEPILPWIATYLRPYRGRVAALVALSTLEVLLRVLSPWPLKALVDHVLGPAPIPAGVGALLQPFLYVTSVVEGERQHLLAAIIAAGVVIQLAHQLVMMCHSRITSGTGQRMVRDLRERLFSHLQALTLSQHGKMATGDLIYRLESDAGCLEHLVMRGAFPIAFSALTLLVMFVGVASIDTPLALVSLAVTPFLFLWLKFYGRRMRPAAERTKELESAMVEHLHQTMTAIPLIKSYAREDFESDRFSSAADRALTARARTTRQESLFSAIVTTLTNAGTSLVLLVGGLSVLNGRISLGTLLLLAAYLGFVYGPLCGIANTTGALQQAVASARRVRATLALSPEPADAPDAIDAASIVRGAVEFDCVSFSYDEGTDVLREVSFTANPGELIALVGPSGSGKSTTMSLMTRLFEAASGRILIDGTDIRRFSLRSLRRRIAVVQQEPLMISGSVRENIRYGRLDGTDGEIEAAADAAGALDFIATLPERFETRLGEGGQGLSGGQKQRLSIARAFLKNAPVLILDEPTSALDGITEQAVLDSLTELRKERTTFVIAHRLSTVRSADRILVFENGTIVAEGRHEDLIRTSTLYGRLAQQLGAVPPARRPEQVILHSVA
jgi:ABC-type multidrug transport system fused ATPase/permease subunit